MYVHVIYIYIYSQAERLLAANNPSKFKVHTFFSVAPGKVEGTATQGGGGGGGPGGGGVRRAPAGGGIPPPLPPPVSGWERGGAGRGGAEGIWFLKNGPHVRYTNLRSLYIFDSLVIVNNSSLKAVSSCKINPPQYGYSGVVMEGRFRATIQLTMAGFVLTNAKSVSGCLSGRVGACRSCENLFHVFYPLHVNFCDKVYVYKCRWKSAFSCFPSTILCSVFFYD